MGARRLVGRLLCCGLLLILRRRRARSVRYMSLWRPLLMVVMMPMPVSLTTEQNFCIQRRLCRPTFGRGLDLSSLRHNAV